MKYIDADKFIKKFEKMIDDIPASVDSGAGYVIDEVYKIFDSLQQEQPTLNKSQQEFVNIVTERMLKEGPIPTLKGKQKAEFEKEFNRFKQITGMINFPAYMEIYKKIILWFMAWGADNLSNLGKPIDLGKMDIQQEQPEVDLEEEVKKYFEGYWPGMKTPEACNHQMVFTTPAIMRMIEHFYELGLNARKEE